MVGNTFVCTNAIVSSSFSFTCPPPPIKAPSQTNRADLASIMEHCVSPAFLMCSDVHPAVTFSMNNTHMRSDGGEGWRGGGGEGGAQFERDKTTAEREECKRRKTRALACINAALRPRLQTQHFPLTVGDKL